MAGPTIHNVAAQTGALQSVISPKRTDDTKKDSEVRRAPAGKDDEEEGAKAGKTRGASQASGTAGTKRTRRKKVSLDQTGSKQTEKSSSSKDAQGVQRQGATEKTQQAQADQASDSKALGYAKAASKLNEQSKLVQASVQHEQSQRDNPQPELSQMGRKRAMLNNLVTMTGINHSQHTGDKAGEAYNRRGAREAHMALKGLRDGNMNSSGTSSTDRINGKGVKFDRHKLETVSRFHAEEAPPEAGYEAFEATG